MRIGSSRMLVRTASSATTVLLAGGLLFAGTGAATALDFGSLATGSSGSLGTGSSSTPIDPTDRLASIANFRDVGGNEGHGYAIGFGQHLKRGVVYRANALSSATDADLQTLTDLGLISVLDMRGQSEIDNPFVGGPDKIPAGADYSHIPIEFGDLVQLAQTIQSPEQGRQYMVDANRSFVTDPLKRAAFKQVLTDIADAPGPAVFHCSAGKDRTGWVAALLQQIGGASADTVMADYLLSNDYLAGVNARTLAQISGALGEQAALNLTPVLGVDASYLEAGLAQIRADYGNVLGYLTDGLGLDTGTLAKLAIKMRA
ncbi:protein-tyrosine phosphatase [Rhodococcus sp. OK519]|uniref:tyrosine-protein phosphatase n=1 Tax=Rhodococcus sp. OK519 TaxID=2135729 RepID=UPI000D3335B5|nr:protein-tyrosine phosphatase [Rhodococcus sp. OK519]